MIQTSDEVLLESLNEALETMAFLTALPAEEELPSPEQSVVVTMRFEGPNSGSFQLAGGRELTQYMAANALGLDPDDEEVQDKDIDAFKELLNTTCGLLLPQLADLDSDAFNITTPDAEILDSPQAWDEYIAQPGVSVWDVEGMPIAIRSF